MPARFAYSPRVYVYTKDHTGTVYNISPWVVSGNVNRVINAVSTAEIVLRNPYKRFTTPSLGVAFHPMDPITIYMERIAGFPVRVFTGYLNQTPYYQMYPGTITITASCTLKKLQFSYFDPSLPFVISFFGKYGWFSNYSGSLFNFQSRGSPQTVNPQSNVSLQDTSIAKLLWATVYEIGQWDDSQIYIEAIPNGIAERMAQLMSSMNKAQGNAANDFNQFLQSVIGSMSQGGGNGGTAPSDLTILGKGRLKSTKNLTVAGQPMNATQLAVANIALDTCAKYHASTKIAAAMLYAATGESNMGTDTGGGASFPANQNVWQQQYYTGDSAATQAYYWLFGGHQFQSAFTLDQQNPTYQIWQLANDVERNKVWNATRQDSYAGKWNGSSVTGEQEMMRIVQAYNNSPATGNSNPQNIIQGTSFQSGISAPPQSTKDISSYYTSPFPGGSNGASIVTNERTDQGVDWSLTPGNVVAIGNGVVIKNSEPGWGPPNGIAPGGFLCYQLTDGPNQGAIIYYAEGINITVNNGQQISKGQTVGISNGSAVEFGYCDSSGTPLGHDQWVSPNWNQKPTDAGMRFARFMRLIGVSTQEDPGSGPYTPTGNNQLYNGGVIVSGSNSGNTVQANSATAFIGELTYPTLEDEISSITLGAEHKGLMNDQMLLTFVQQLSQASLRSFQSLPDGSFYAFYPDYFGEFGQHNAYWLIDNIEIIDGGVNLNDEALATHVFAIGNNTWPAPESLITELFSAGTVNIFNAFLTPGFVDLKKNPFSNGQFKQNNGLEALMNTNEAVEFIKRYGARPLVGHYDQVYSNLFEMVLAYQQFMYAWANQFITPFQFTFMPELYPGGKVGFPDHNIKMYIQSVEHTWDYENDGFLTSATLTAPSLLNPAAVNQFPELPPNMVEALIEPIKEAAKQQKGKAPSPNDSQIIQQSAYRIAGSIDEALHNIVQGF